MPSAQRSAVYYHNRSRWPFEQVRVATSRTFTDKCDAPKTQLTLSVESFFSKSRLHSRSKYPDRVLYGTDLGYRPQGDSDSLELGSQPTCGIGVFSNRTVEFRDARASSCRTLSSASDATITPCAGFQRLRTRRKTDRLFLLKGLIRRVDNGPQMSG